MKQKTTPREFGLKMLARREHSVSEFREKLFKKFKDENITEEVDKIVAEFLEKNWISDERFCEVFIRDQVLKKSGPQKILQKLRLKGVDKYLARKILDDNFEVEEFYKIAQRLADKKKVEILRKKSGISDFELRGRVTNFLVGRGFGFDVIKRVLA